MQARVFFDALIVDLQVDPVQSGVPSLCGIQVK